MKAPQVCLMDSQTTLAEIRKKAPFYVPEWNTEGEKDFGIALSRIFADMTETITNRLNEAPMKHFISFLEMLDTSIIPAIPARAPLTFMLSEGSSGNVLLESFVQASADGPDGKPVIFETEKNIVATPSKLVSVHSVIKDRDEIFDHTSAIDGAGSAELFAGERSLQEHVLYIGDENLFNLQEGFITIIFEGSQEDLLRKLGYGVTESKGGLAEWEYGLRIKEEKYGKGIEAIQWCPFDSAEVNNDQLTLKKGPVSGRCTKLKSDAVISDKIEVNGTESRWIRCRISENRVGEIEDMSLTGLKVSVSPLQTSVNRDGSVQIKGTSPDLLYYNDTPVLTEDPKEALYPFGTKPKIYDTFYIASRDAFSKRGYKVSLNFKLHHGRPSSSDSSDIPMLSWEYWDGESWSVLEIDKSAEKNLSDNTICSRRIISRSTADTFTPTVLTVSDMPDVKPVRINGKENYWIRTRLTGGNYGKEYHVNDNHVSAGSFCPPGIREFLITYEDNGKETQPEYVFAANNLELDSCLDEIETRSICRPFKTIPDVHPAVYFGFDRELWKGPFSLFVNIDESIAYPRSFMPEVRWQVLTDEDSGLWKALDVLDETSGFKESGMVQFTVPERMKASAFLGSGNLYWIRAVITGEFFKKEFPAGMQDPLPSREYLMHLKKGRPLIYRHLELKLADISKPQPARRSIPAVAGLNIPYVTDTGNCKNELELFKTDLLPGDLKILPPKIIGFYLNSVRAVQSRTIRDEIAGSGNGQANQKVSLVNAPVIDETIWVDEGNIIPEKEQKMLLKSPGKVIPIKDDKGNVLHFWVRWTSVSGFFNSASKDRHYIIDRNTGEVFFGNGEKGMVPPAGANNIRATYSTGGGAAGNLDALMISKLQSSIAFVDKVFNPVSSDGGTEAEDMDLLIKRAPAVLKHRNRAMAVEDYEWLSKEASRNVARTKIIPNFNQEGKFSTGWVTVIIVPASSDPQPVPSNGLKHRVTEYLAERCPAIVNLNVISPSYVKVDVSAQLVTGDIDAIPIIEREAGKRISDFLHPLTGHVLGKGWSFGFAPCVSDIYPILEQIQDVDHVNNVTITLHDSSRTMVIEDTSAKVRLPEYALPCSGENKISVEWKNSLKEG
jgi:hypothetical protein